MLRMTPSEAGLSGRATETRRSNPNLSKARSRIARAASVAKPAAPRVRGQAPADLDRSRNRVGRTETDEAEQRAGGALLDGAAAVAVAVPVRHHPLEHLVAALAGERATEERHHDRVRVDLGKRLDVVVVPGAQQQPVRHDDRLARRGGSHG
jgi:hypothetical protein